MPSPLSVDLRERVVAAVVAGVSCHRAAARFGVSVSSASRWSSASATRANSPPSRWGRSHLEAHRGTCRADPEDLQAGAASFRARPAG